MRFNADKRYSRRPASGNPVPAPEGTATMQMRILIAAALAVAAPVLHAYQIVEGRYRVEIAPGVFEDQLIVRCDDGRTLTVPWETRLAEACGEGLMGERVGTPAKAPPAPRADTLEAAPAATGSPAAGVTPGVPGALFDEAAQKEAMLGQIRAQFGAVPEHYIEFKPGPDGLSMRLLPPLNEIVKKYEACRRAREPGAQCAAQRDQAVAKLSETLPAEAASAEPPRRKAGTKAERTGSAAGKIEPAGAPAAAGKDAAMPSDAGHPTAQATPSETALPDTASKSEAQASDRVAAAATPAKPPVKPLPALDRAAMEQKIAEEHVVCMRLKPKFECEQARARALGALDRPKPAKPARAAKQAKAASPKVAAAPAQ
jgi:hypothetical protein